MDELVQRQPCQDLLTRRWGEAPSIQSNFIRHTLSLISTRLSLIKYETLILVLWFQREKVQLANFIALDIDPWTIATEEDLRHLGAAIGLDHASREKRRFWKRGMFRFSAAATAIQFLPSISKKAVPVCALLFLMRIALL